jgi:hypothetical protein
MSHTVYMLHPPCEDPYPVFPNVAVYAFTRGWEVYKVEVESVGGPYNVSHLTQEDVDELIKSGKVRMS